MTTPDDDHVTVSRAWLREVADDMEGWGAYAADYFKEKWNLAADVQRVRDAADAVVVYGCDVDGHPNNYTHTHPWPGSPTNGE